MAKVSVIIPTHNRAELLCFTVKSVMNQTFQDFEIIIVDDASTDNTEEIVNSLRDKRIKYIRHETNKGEAGTRNTGVQNGKGEYIAWLDDDDEWLPDKLQRQVAILDHSPKEVGGVYTGRVNVDGTTGRILSRTLASKRGNLFSELLYHGYYLCVSSLMLRKSCFEKTGWFDESIPYGLDHDMWVRIAKEFQFECIEEPLTKYRIHEKRLSTNFDRVIKGKEKILEKYDQGYKKHPKILSKKFLEIGILYCLNGNPKEGRKAFLRTISLDPLRIKPYCIFFLSCLGTKVFRKVIKLWNELPKLASLSHH